jgi:hypothetical protein
MPRNIQPFRSRQSGSLAPALRHVIFKVAVAAVFAAAFCGATTSYAETVIISITGTVSSGTDYTGIFGPASATLAGRSFALTFTFDDTKAPTINELSCEYAKGAGASSLGTAVLEIGTSSWTFGQLTNSSPSSAVQWCSYFDYQVVDTPPESTPDPGEDWVDITGFAPVDNVRWQEDIPTVQVVGQRSGSFMIAVESSPGVFVAEASGNLTPATITVGGPQAGSGPSAAALQFVPVTPCRIADTRNAAGPFGGPAFAPGTSRAFAVSRSACSIPSSALAYSLNVTAVPYEPLGYLTVWPTGQTLPSVSTLNSDGRVKANAAILPAGTNGDVSVYVSDSTDVVLDIDGYFVPSGAPSALAFYAVTPCRAADTRNATGSLGGPFLTAGSTRSFPIQSGGCGLPSGAEAYSLNVTAVPRGKLDYLTMWPSGQSQPLVSSLNAPTGAVTANAAIVPAGDGGNVSVFVTGDTDIVLDVNGYFAAPGANGLSLYAITPCRELDTRSSSGAFIGTLGVDVQGSGCAASPSAQAYVLNATVVPTGSLGYLTLWPAGETQPAVSTLNAIDGTATSNMAIVPTINGSIDAFSSSSTQLILDVSSYFAP